jgi:multiple sugar transport system substrate-binding protein
VAMQKVLTDKNANIDQLLASSETQVNSILASVK